MVLSQFGFLYVGPDAAQPHQISHLDDSSNALVSIFLVSDVDLGDGKTSSSTAPATEFVDLAAYGFKKISPFKRKDKAKHLLKWNNPAIWGPDSIKFKKTTFAKGVVVQFEACTVHQGSGPGEEGEKVERFVCFAVHTVQKHCHTYQKKESPIMAPEVLLLIIEEGPEEVKPQAKQFLKDWKTKLGSADNVVFNYTYEDEDAAR